MAALVLGVVAVLTFWTVIGGILLGLAAAIMGSFGVGRVHRGRARNRGTALGGIVTGVLGVVASVVFLVSGLSALSGFLADNHGAEFARCAQLADGPAQVRQCATQFLPPPP